MILLQLVLVIWFACAEWCGGWGLVLVGGWFCIGKGGALGEEGLWVEGGG